MMILELNNLEKDIDIIYKKTIKINKNLIINVPLNYKCLLFIDNDFLKELGPCNELKILDICDKKDLNKKLDAYFILNTGLPLMYWGFGNIPIYYDNNYYYVGSNGKFSINITNNLKFLYSLNLNDSIIYSDIKEKINSIIKNIGAPILNNLLKINNRSIHEINLIQNEFKNELFKELNKDHMLLDLGININYLTVEGFKVNLENNNQDIAKEIYKKNVNAIIEINSLINNQLLMGSGILIDNNYVLTNAHNIFKEENNKFILSEFISAKTVNDQDLSKLDLIYANNKLDLAILKYNKPNINKVNFSNNKYQTGDNIFVIGNSKGLGISIVDGIISNHSFKKDNLDFIMFSASINHGNSGGPLFDKKGDLIGIVTYSLNNANNINYAIPISRILDFIIDVENKEGINIIN